MAANSKYGKIALFGGAGWPNYGDELILDAWKQYFKKNNIAKRVVFYEGSTRSAKNLHKFGSSKGVFSARDDIERIAAAVKDLGFWQQVIRGYDFLENKGTERYQIDFSDLIESECIHLHGGGYLNKLWPVRGFYLGLAAAFNRAFGTKIAATGIGIGPVDKPASGQKGKLKEIFSRFSIFELRDVDYFRFLKKELGLTNVYFGLDDCFLKPVDEIFEKSETANGRLYLSFLAYNIKNFKSSFWQELRDRAKKYDEVVFFESSPEQDFEVKEFLSNNVGIDYTLSVKDSIQSRIPVGENDEVICSRFHVHYIFSRYGLRGLYNQDNSYYDVKHQSIVDRGSGFILSSKVSDLDLAGKARRSMLSINDESLTKQKEDMAKLIYG